MDTGVYAPALSPLIRWSPGRGLVSLSVLSQWVLVVLLLLFGVIFLFLFVIEPVEGLPYECEVLFVILEPAVLVQTLAVRRWRIFGHHVGDNGIQSWPVLLISLPPGLPRVALRRSKFSRVLSVLSIRQIEYI